MKNLFLILCLLFSFAEFAQAKVFVRDVNLKTDSQGTYFELKLDKQVKNVKSTISIRDNILQAELRDVVVWPKIEKKVFNERYNEVTISAYQYDNKTVRFRAVFEKKIDELTSRLRVKQNKRYLSILGDVKFKSNKKKNVAAYNENYLDKLIKDKTSIEEKVSKDIKEINKKDVLKYSYSGPEKQTLDTGEGGSGLQFWGYIAKFFGFLVLILLGIYGALFVLKKGVVKKNKLGFLNDKSLINVLSNHYLGPKKNIMMVKAHKQVFLVGVCENEISLISEISNVSSLMKDGEKILLGSNYETSEETATDGDKEFVLKKDINKSSELVSLKTGTKKRITDQIRRKVKEMKDLQ